MTYQGITVETNVLEITIKENTADSVITAYEEVHVTTEKGVVPVLPSSIRATFKDGLPKNVPVVWDPISEEQCMEYGEFVVNGTVEGQELQPEAVVLVKGVTGVQQFSTAVPMGTVPRLSEKARLYYSDGMCLFYDELTELWGYMDMTGDVAFIIGGENSGVHKLSMRLADGVIGIPQFGRINSLNASVAAAVVAYEALRQRTGG